MSSESWSLHKEWGLLPLVLSAIGTASVIILSIYHANQTGTPLVYAGGKYIQCDRAVAALLNAITHVYKYTGLLLMFVSLVSVVFSYFYDRAAFIFITICFVFLSYPFAAVLDNNKIILISSSVERICRSGSYLVVLIQLPILFFSSYVMLGNIVLLAKRWRRGRT